MEQTLILDYWEQRFLAINDQESNYDNDYDA